MGRGIAGIDFVIPALGHAFFADQRHGQAMGVVHIIQPEAAFHAKPLLVGGPVAAIDLDDFVVFQVIGDLAPNTAERADTINRAVGCTDTHASFIDHGGGQQGPGRAGLDAFAAGHASGLAHGVVEIEDDFRLCASRRDADHVVGLDFAAGLDAQITIDAGIQIDRHRGVAGVRGGGVTRGEAAPGDLASVRPLPEFGIRIMGGAALGLVGHQQLEDHLTGFRGPFCLRVDHHAVGGLAQAGCRQHALTLDMHHAGTAIAVRPVTGLGRIAKMRDIHAFTRGDLPDGVIRGRLDRAAVEGEGNGFAHGRVSVPCARCSCPEGLLNFDQFHVEHQGRVRRDNAARAAGAISKIRLEDQGALAARLHARNTFVPALDDASGAEGE